MDSATQATTTIAARERARLGTLAQLAVLTTFWVYVTVSNVLYAHNMSLSFDPAGNRHLFATWPARSLQHLLLYPVLLLCVQLAMRIGWRPLPRRAPLQVVLALVFALLASPLLGVSEHLVGDTVEMPQPEDRIGMPWQGPQSELPLRIASATNFLLTYGFALALVSGFSLYQRFRDSELRRAALERAWTAARLAALRMQLSPHTLFNLLHTIRGQIGWDPEAAQNMVMQLGDLLRRLLTAGETEFTPLSAEIEFARLYLALQQQRFEDRLTLSLPDPATLPRAWVPSLILQPLIENAVVHGLAGHSGPVNVSIKVESDAQQLRLIVRNTTGTISASRSGIGLRNVTERLTVHFAERGTLLLQTEPPTAWSAIVQLPLLLEPPGPAAASAARPEMMQVVIVDDEPSARRTLRECCAREPDLHIAGEYGDGRSALSAILASPPDLLFLDIQIDSVNGIALARSLDPQTLPDIVFVTAYDRYALEAFEVCASDYLLKPFDYQRFQATVARVRRKRGDAPSEDRRNALLSVVSKLEREVKALADSSPRIIAESGSSMHILNIADIELVEGDRNYVKFSVGREQYHARSTLAQAEASLSSQPMLRISRSCLINVNYIRELSRTPRGDFIFVLACGTTVTSSEGHREGVREHLNTMKLGT